MTTEGMYVIAEAQSGLKQYRSWRGVRSEYQTRLAELASQQDTLQGPLRRSPTIAPASPPQREASARLCSDSNESEGRNSGERDWSASDVAHDDAGRGLRFQIVTMVDMGRGARASTKAFRNRPTTIQNEPPL